MTGGEFCRAVAAVFVITLGVGVILTAVFGGLAVVRAHGVGRELASGLVGAGLILLGCAAALVVLRGRR